jgi:hypothetical protein
LAGFIWGKFCGVGVVTGVSGIGAALKLSPGEVIGVIPGD